MYHEAWRVILPLLNPQHVHLVGIKASLTPDDLLPSIHLDDATWTNLSLLTLSNCDARGSDSWACLNGTVRDVVVVLNVSGEGGKSDLLLVHRATEARLTRVKKVVVRSSSKEMSRKFQVAVEEMCSSLSYKAETLYRRKGLLSFEVEDEGEL